MKKMLVALLCVGSCFAGDRFVPQQVPQPVQVVVALGIAAVAGNNPMIMQNREESNVTFKQPKKREQKNQKHTKSNKHHNLRVQQPRKGY